MKTLVILLIFISINLNVKAEGIGEWRPDGFHLNEGIGPINDLDKAQELWNKYGKNINLKDFNEKISYMYSSSVERAPCPSCPEYLKLSKAVNQAIQEMPVKDITLANLVTIRSNELEFMYVINQYEREDGSVGCKKIFDTHPLREIYEGKKEGKKEGKYRVLTSTIMQMTGIGNVQFLNKELGAVFYYYRGTGDKKNIIYEVISKKDRPYTITAYQYQPTDKEMNPYNLPDLGASSENGAKILEKSERLEVLPPSAIDPNYVDFEFRLEKRRKYIPKDYHILSAGTEMDLLDYAKLKSKSKLSIKERSTKWSLTPIDGNDEYLRLELKHKGVDELATKFVIPYRIEVDAVSSTKISGQVSQELVREGSVLNDEKSNSTVSLVLTNHDLEFLRLDAKKSYNGNTMLTLGHRKSLAPNEAISINGGYREDGATNKGASFIGIQHAKKIKESTSLVLDLKYDTQTKGSILWQVHHKL